MKKHSGERGSRRRKKRKGPRKTPQQAKSRPEERVVLTTIATAPSYQDYDHDCPWCRAQRELGLRDGDSLTTTQYAAYQARVDEIIRDEGMPEGAVHRTGEQLRRRYQWISTRLQAEGRETDPERVPDHEFPAFYERVQELTRMYDQLN
jgi:hypothetical protein